MKKSDRFKPIQNLAQQKERDAAAHLGKTLRDREAAQQRLSQLQDYLAEYLDRYASACRQGLAGAHIQEYRAFIGKLELAITEQRRIVSGAERVCDDSRNQWQSKYTRSRAMDTVLERMRLDERRAADKREQRELDEQNQRRR